jgi:hypothetical protein
MGDWYSNYTALKQSSDELTKQYEANAARAKVMYEGIIARWSKQCTDISEASTQNHKKAMALLGERNATIRTLRQDILQLTNELKAVPKDKPLGQREGDTLRKLVIGLAMVAYAYDPKAARSEVAAEIASDLAERGLTISDDTVRKHLKESAELLPPPDAPERKRSER